MQSPLCVPNREKMYVDQGVLPLYGTPVPLQGLDISPRWRLRTMTVCYDELVAEFTVVLLGANT